MHSWNVQQFFFISNAFATMDDTIELSTSLNGVSVCVCVLHRNDFSKSMTLFSESMLNHFEIDLGILFLLFLLLLLSYFQIKL